MKWPKRSISVRLSPADRQDIANFCTDILGCGMPSSMDERTRELLYKVTRDKRSLK